MSEQDKGNPSAANQTEAERVLADRKALRSKMADDVEAFLKAGGKVEEVERGKRSDPPRKPESQYGSRPI